MWAYYNVINIEGNLFVNGEREKIRGSPIPQALAKPRPARLLPACGTATRKMLLLRDGKAVDDRSLLRDTLSRVARARMEPCSIQDKSMDPLPIRRAVPSGAHVVQHFEAGVVLGKPGITASAKCNIRYTPYFL